MSEATLTTWHQTIDFNSLMVEARKHITELAGELWTDHNSSDPGITQLEVLAFCIADLSYRTSFDVKDILAGYKGDNLLDIDLPLADVALPNAPVTINDLRKVMVDMPNPKNTDLLLLRNVYPTIVEGIEVPFYAVGNDKAETQLSFGTTYERKKDLTEVSLSEQQPLEALSPLNAKTTTKAPVSKKGATNSSATNTAATAEVSDTQVTSSSSAREYDNIKEVLINGLYGLQVEFEDQKSDDPNEDLPDYLKDLNQNYFEEEITVGGQTYTLSVLLPYWDEINWQLKDVNLLDTNTQLEYRKRDNANQDDYFIAVDKLNYDDYFYDYYAELDLNGHTITAFIKVVNQSEHEITVQGKPLKFKANFLDWNELSNSVVRNYTQINAQGGFERVRNVSVGNERVYDIRSLFNGMNLLTRITFNDPEEIDVTMESGILYELEFMFGDIFAQQVALENEIYTKLQQKSANIYSAYLTKIDTVFKFLYGTGGIWNHIGKYRNLCEDYAKFSASRVQEVALFGKVLAQPGVNPNELLGEIYYRVDEFLDPLIRFHTLSEMTEMGYSFQEIFNGPLLLHGFVRNEDLNDLKRRSVVYTSDLIRIIMDVPGVLAVEDFNISSYIDNRLMGRNVINCLNLTNSDVYKPRFSSDKTKLAICVDDSDAEINPIDVEAWYQSKLNSAKSTQRPSGVPYQLELPTGQDRKIEEYRSIQHDFPEIYGIGEFGLPLDADDDRRGRAKQLKAFLLPFEQLLANYLKQVAHLPELFSYSRDVADTYATQPLYEVPDVQPLFSGFVHSNDTWDAFKQDINNTYALAMKKGESEEDFRSRRNRFLSQLLSRFGESFAAYAEQMFDRHKHLLNNPNGGITAYQQAQAATLDKLIDDKITFGEEYEQVSAGRYNAFDTTFQNGYLYPDGAWNDDNIGNYKRRLCRLLGIEEVNNTYLFGAATATNGSVIDIEGMHILEHVLLRPRMTNTALMQLQNQPVEGGGLTIYDSDKDPYSFRITIVLPLNAGRFQSPDFRRFTERLIRMETPAHIGVDFKWFPTRCGQQFEAAYSAWKKSVHLMKPWYFQQLTGRKLPPELLISIPTIENELKDAPSIISLQNNLINALNTPCKAEMQLFNASHQLLQEEAGVVRFQVGATDVFHIKVSHPEGKFTIFEWNSASSDWELKIEDDTVPVSYYAVDEYTSDVTIGLTQHLGGVGRYRVSYAHDDYPTLDTVIEVTPAPIPVDIYIGNKDIYLEFETETDGVFRRSNKDWDGYFLEFVNYTERAIITITGNGYNQVSIIPKKGAGNRILFSDLYQQFGAGTFRIEYRLGGESTFAEIELYLELSIYAFYGDIEQVAGRDGITLLNANEVPTKFTFDVPEGSLTVTDLDGTLPAFSQVSNRGESTATASLMDDQHVLYAKKVTELNIDISNDSRFVPGHRYLFEYTKEGFRTTRIFRWETPKKVDPKMDFLLNDSIIEEDPVMLNPKLSGYSLSLSPAGYNLSIVTADGEPVLQMDDLQKEDLIVPLFVDQFLGYSTNNFKAIYGDDTVSIEREFSIIRIIDPVVNDVIKVTNSMTEETRGIIDDRIEITFEFNNPKLFYTLNAVYNPGELILVDEDENKQVFSVSEEGLKLEGHFLHSDTYKASYVSQDYSIEFFLDVINPNPTFELQSIIQKGQEYTALGIPLYPYGKTYIWRVDGKYVSRAKQPNFTFDFKSKEAYDVELTLHYEELEPSYSLKVTEELLQAWMNEK